MLFNTTVRVKSYQFLHIKSKFLYFPVLAAPFPSANPTGPYEGIGQQLQSWDYIFLDEYLHIAHPCPYYPPYPSS